MRAFSRADNVCALLLVIFLFFPWIDIGGIVSAAGYQLPAAARQMAATLGQTGQPVQGSAQLYLFYLIYLIPAFALATLALNASDFDSKLTSLLAGALPLVLLAIAWAKIGNDLFRILGIGAWLSLIAGLALIVVALRSPSAPAAPAV